MLDWASYFSIYSMFLIEPTYKTINVLVAVYEGEGEVT